MAEIHVEQKRRGGLGWLWIVLLLLLAALAWWVWTGRDRAGDVEAPAAAGATSALPPAAPAVSWRPAIEGHAGTLALTRDAA